jgi:hypothetical protein
MKLASQKRLRRYQRKTYSILQGRLGKLWADFGIGDISADQLLHALVLELFTKILKSLFAFSSVFHDIAMLALN